MKVEMKLLARRITALFLSLALVVGLAPAKINAETRSSFSVTMLDYADTYYNGFNDEVAVATGTCIELSYGDELNYLFIEEAVAKEEGNSYSDEITINYSESADAEIVYEDGSVYLYIFLEGEEIYSQMLYTPEYVELSEMPTIALNQEIKVANGVGKYCKQYYRIDGSTLSGQNSYKVFTLAIDEEYDTDTHIFLYDEHGMLVDDNDDTDGEEEDIDSSLTFEMPETGERIICVQGYEYSEMVYTTLKLVAGAKRVVEFTSDNIDRLNVFYEGFNDDVLYATGTRIQATLDNGTVSEWQSYGLAYDYDEDEDTDGMTILFGDVKARLYRGQNGSVYAEYGLSYDSSTTRTKLFFTPVIKQVSDIPTITEGSTTINSLPWDGAYSYYRITAEEEEVWNLNIAFADDSDPWEIGIDGYEADGTFLFNYESEYDDDTDEVLGLDIDITIPAGSTRIIGLYDYADYSQELILTATKQKDEEPTTEEVTTEEVTTEEITTEEITTEEVTTVEETTVEVTTEEKTTSKVEPTTNNNNPTVAPQTTKSAEQKKIEEFNKAGKVKIKKASKKKASKKAKISLKKSVKAADGYQVRFYKTKKNANKNKKAIAKITVKKNSKSITVKSKKIAKRKTLYVRVRSYIKVKGKTYTGKWSSVKKVKISK